MLRLIGLIVALLTFAPWAAPSTAVAHVQGPDAQATMTRAAADQAANDCQAHGEPDQAGCRGLACCPQPGAPAGPDPLVTGLRPALPVPCRSARGASLIPDVRSPPPKA